MKTKLNLKELIIVCTHFYDRPAVYYRGKFAGEIEDYKFEILLKHFSETKFRNTAFLVLTEDCTHMLDKNGNWPEEFSELEIDIHEPFPFRILV